MASATSSHCDPTCPKSPPALLTHWISGHANPQVHRITNRADVNRLPRLAAGDHWVQAPSIQSELDRLKEVVYCDRQFGHLVIPLLGGEMNTKKEDIDYGTYGRENLSEQIADRILGLIKERKLLPGDKLPPERELSQQMGVSRPSLREALRALSIMRVIGHRQGSGTYITSLEPNYLIEHLDFIFALDDSTYLDLLEARKVIESGIAELAAQGITDDQIQELEALHEESIRSADNHEEFLKADLKIHDVICEASSNSILQRIMASLVKISIHSRRRTVQIGEIREQTIGDHGKIIRTLANRDSTAARQAMLDHLNHVEKGLKTALSKQYSEESSVAGA